MVTEKGMKVRSSINKKIDYIGDVIRLAGINTKITYYPPPAIGGPVTTLDVIENTFNLRSFSITPIEIIDQLDKALGIYEADEKRAFIRTFNPFFWMGRLFVWLSSLPFMFLHHAGFDVVKIQTTIWGKLLKLFFDCVAFAAGVLTIFQVLGYVGVLQSLKAIIDSMLP
ncbi:hypothetical protein LRY60_02910 [Candidatus Woesebacteria bacterium]|nr:hypothetical protein [Candidatus Woesebacteria bacterium]